MNTHWKKEDTIALCMKWCEVLILSAISSITIGLLILRGYGDVRGGLLLAGVCFLLFAASVVGCYVFTVMLGMLVWKSWLKFSFPFLMLPPLVFTAFPFGMALMAYWDGKKIISKAGYSIGIWGPREITLFGKKNR